MTRFQMLDHHHHSRVERESPPSRMRPLIGSNGGRQAYNKATQKVAYPDEADILLVHSIRHDALCCIITNNKERPPNLRIGACYFFRWLNERVSEWQPGYCGMRLLLAEREVHMQLGRGSTNERARFPPISFLYGDRDRDGGGGGGKKGNFITSLAAPSAL